MQADREAVTYPTHIECLNFDYLATAMISIITSPAFRMLLKQVGTLNKYAWRAFRKYDHIIIGLR